MTRIVVLALATTTAMGCLLSIDDTLADPRPNRCDAPGITLLASDLAGEKALSNALAHVPVGGTVKFPAGRFTPGAVTFLADRTYCGGGVVLDGSENRVEVGGVTSTWIEGFVFVGKGLGVVGSVTGLTVAGCTFQDVGVDINSFGLNAQNLEDAVIRDNTWKGGHGVPLYLNPSARRTEVRNNTFEGTDGCLFVYSFESITVTGNRGVGVRKGLPCLELHDQPGTMGLVVTDNVIAIDGAASSRGIVLADFSAARNGTFRGNRVSATSVEAGSVGFSIKNGGSVTQNRFEQLDIGIAPYDATSVTDNVFCSVTTLVKGNVVGTGSVTSCAP